MPSLAFSAFSASARSTRSIRSALFCASALAAAGLASGLTLPGAAAAAAWDSPEAVEESEAPAARAAVVVFSRLSTRAALADETDAGNPDAMSRASLMAPASGGRLAGRAESVAVDLGAKLGVPVQLLETKKIYPGSYEEMIAENAADLAAGTLPELLNPKLADPSAEVVYLGFPIWHMQLPPAVKTFLTANRWAGKTIVPFCTNMGWGSGKARAQILNLADGAVVTYAASIDADDLLAPEVREKAVEALIERGTAAAR